MELRSTHQRTVGSGDEPGRQTERAASRRQRLASGDEYQAPRDVSAQRKRKRAAPEWTPPVPAFSDLSRADAELSARGVTNPMMMQDGAASSLELPGGRVTMTKRVPPGSHFDGVQAMLQHTKHTGLDWMGHGFDSRSSLPKQGMEGQFKHHRQHHGPVESGRRKYDRMDYDRETETTVLSRRFEGADGLPRTALEWWQDAPKKTGRGWQDAAATLPRGKKTMTLVHPDPAFQIEPAIATAHAAGGKLKAGSTVRLSGLSFEKIDHELSTAVTADAGFTSPSRNRVQLVTTALVRNREEDDTIQHRGLVIRSEPAGRGGQTTLHETVLEAQRLNIPPQGTQSIEIEAQSGWAHVEFHSAQTLEPQGSTARSHTSSVPQSTRHFILDETEGSRHEGDFEFLSADHHILDTHSARAGTPAEKALKSQGKSEGATTKATLDVSAWKADAESGAGRAKENVSATFEFTNQGAYAGQQVHTVKLARGYSATHGLKLNGRAIGAGTTKIGAFTVTRGKTDWYGTDLIIRADLEAGQNKTCTLKFEGSFRRPR